MRFKKKKGCYLDTETGLQWALKNFGPMSWDKATAEFNGSNGWRLPTIDELLTLVDYTKFNPATSLPDMVSSYYWSATTYAGSTYGAWSVYFYYGSGSWSCKSSSHYVRTVRGGVVGNRGKNSKN